MRLTNYINDNNTNAYAFAELVGVSPQTVYRWLSGEDRPSSENEKKIFVLTKGQVAPNDFFEMPSTTSVVNSQEKLTSGGSDAL